jgi:hypothetical protein
MNYVAALAVIALATAAPANAGAGAFTLVNGATSPLKEIAIRRFGTQQWQAVSPAAAPGARQSVTFSDPDCSFDIQAKLDGSGEVVWTGVNLCEVKTVILNRNESGEIWVDYD